MHGGHDDDGALPARVAIAGGGVAALEEALALARLAGDRVIRTLVTPATDFVYRPLGVLSSRPTCTRRSCLRRSRPSTPPAAC
ncbi:MAG: hypothetical protein ABSH51_20565 [Solirubrobacteraceae bacterium]|jgi:hypothetical protein